MSSDPNAEAGLMALLRQIVREEVQAAFDRTAAEDATQWQASFGSSLTLAREKAARHTRPCTLVCPFRKPGS